MRTIVMCRVDGRSDYGATIILSEGYEHFVGERKEFIHSKEGNFQRYLCYWEKSPYGWDRCENYYFEPNFPVPALPTTVTITANVIAGVEWHVHSDKPVRSRGMFLFFKS